MEKFIQQLINGVSLGSVYGLIALGYTMVYGIIKLINFAHGDLYMIGAYVGFVCTTFLGLGFFPSLIIAMVFCALLGVAIEKVAYKPLRNGARITALITAIGVSIVLEYVTMFIFKPEVRTYPNVIVNHTYKITDNIIINNIQIYIVVLTVILMLLLQLLIHKSKIGKAMRAVSQDKDAAQLMGINVNTTISFTFAIGSALAGAGGILVGVYYNSISPLMGVLPGLKAFVAAVFGGIGIIPGAMFGGIFLGITETFVSGYGSSTYKDAVAFLILIIILIIKPSGLFGKGVKEKV